MTTPNPTLTQSLTEPQKPVSIMEGAAGANGQTYTAEQVAAARTGVNNDSYANTYAREKYGAVPAEMYKRQFTDPTWAAAESGSEADVRAWIDGLGLTPQAQPTSPIPGRSVMTDAYRVSNVDPTLRTVNAATETTSGQLDRLLAQDSPLMQRARAQALMAQNERGTANSSMAIGAAQAAMVDAATPIANADANTYTQASRDNQQYENAADVFNSQAYNEAQAAGFDASQKLAQLKLQGEIEMGLQQVKNGASVELAHIEAQYKTLMQSNASAAQVYGDISKNITSIVTNKDIPASEKGSMIAQQTELLRSALAIAGAGANIDFLKLLDFSGGPGSTQGGTQLPTATPAPGGADPAMPYSPN